MQKNTHKNTDFFKEFRSAQIHKYLFSGGIAVFAAFGFVSLIHSDIDPRGLMASVVNVSNVPHYDADIMMTRQDDNITFTLGTRAQTVDMIDLTLLGDPSRLHSVTTVSPDIRIIGQSERGVYHVSIDMHGRDIIAGTQIGTLTASIDTGATLSLSDTQFVSGGQRYSLSSQGE
ncbi:hypothetical protein H7170_02455 [Candidatus Gracilibacteria bacterium]|nr:hypothetical protein [Candidatus Gracilibacteria bacterium]